LSACLPVLQYQIKHEALAADRVVAVETGGCPHAAIREDITANVIACEVSGDGGDGNGDMYVFPLMEWRCLFSTLLVFI